jgi:hypothetical protein
LAVLLAERGTASRLQQNCRKHHPSQGAHFRQLL